MNPSTAKMQDEGKDFFEQLVEASSAPLQKSTLLMFVRAVPWV